MKATLRKRFFETSGSPEFIKSFYEKFPGEEI